MENYRLAMIGGAIGFCLALLLITVGFFKTLLILSLIILGASVGFMIQKYGLLEQFKK